MKCSILHVWVLLRFLECFLEFDKSILNFASHNNYYFCWPHSKISADYSQIRVFRFYVKWEWFGFCYDYKNNIFFLVPLNVFVGPSCFAKSLWSLLFTKCYRPVIHRATLCENKIIFFLHDLCHLRWYSLTSFSIQVKHYWSNL